VATHRVLLALAGAAAVGALSAAWSAWPFATGRKLEP
jgi:hypothetical protein